MERRRPQDMLVNRTRGDGVFTSYQDLTKEDILNIIYDYTYTLFSREKVAEKYNTSHETIRTIIDSFKSDFNNLTESWELIYMIPHLDSAVGLFPSTVQSPERTMDHPLWSKPEHINQKFLELLSEPEDPTLTEQEQTYAWIFSQTGNNVEALKTSGLDTGLQKKDAPTTNNSNTAKLRGYYLRSKPNIKNYIYELRERKLTELNIDKSYIQTQLVTLIEQIQEEGDSRERNKLIRAIELLGKTVPGAFTETVNISEVKPDEALDKLLEMSRNVKIDVREPSKLINVYEMED
ncbi:MAG: hypothetical protein ACYC2U_08505 [Candidatus Amoebophilus sp.]